MKKIFIVIVIFNIYSYLNPAEAQDTASVKAFSLREAQEFAYKNSYSVLSAEADIDKARKMVLQTTAIGLPQVNASASYQNFIDIPTQLMPDFLTPAVESVLINQKLIDENKRSPMSNQFFPVQFGTRQNASASLTASQLLFDGSYIVGLQAAKTFVDISKKSYEKTKNDIRESVSQAYFLVLVAEENKSILDSTLLLTKKALDETIEYQKNGFLEDTDVDQLRLLTSTLENKFNMVSRQVEIAYNLLKFQMGMDINQKISLTDKLSDIVQMALAQNLVAQQFDPAAHIDYKLLLTLKKGDELILRKDRFGYLPSLNCFITTARNAYRSDFNFIESNEPWFKTTIFGINLSLPIWDSGLKHFKIQQDKLELKKRNLQIAQTQQGLTLNVQNNISQVKTYSDQYIAEIKNMELAKKIYDKALLKYNQGITSSLELTQVQNQYLATQGSYFNVILQLLNANSNLNKSLGN